MDTNPQSFSASQIVLQQVDHASSGPADMPNVGSGTHFPRSNEREEQKKPGKGVAIIMGGLLLLLLGVVLLPVFPSSHSPGDFPPSSQRLGHVVFLSSQQPLADGTPAIMDEVMMDLTLPPPAAGYTYDAWLLGDAAQSDTPTWLLGSLTIQGNHAHLLYTGDTQHTNVIAAMSRVLITEEDAAVPPIAPSPNQATWRALGALLQDPATAQPAALQHLRRLLTTDPPQVQGGLATLMEQDTQHVMEITTALQENQQDSASTRRQLVRLLTLIDGTAYVQQDLPAALLPLIPSDLPPNGLLTFNHQQPGGLIFQVEFHLSRILQSAAPARRTQLQHTYAPVIEALSWQTSWISQIHDDVKQVLTISAQQPQPSLEVQMALMRLRENGIKIVAGQTDPITGKTYPGIEWVYQQIAMLASFDLLSVPSGYLA